MLIDLSALRFGQLAPLFSASTCELFDCYGVTLEPQPEPVEASAALGPTPALAAFVGIVGERVRGTVLIVAAMPLVQRTHPQAQAGVPVSAAQARDWQGELANQLTGRLKNKLVAYGAGDFQLSPPKCLIGSNLHGFSGGKEGGYLLAFRAGPDGVLVNLTAQFDDSIDFSAPVEGGDSALAEGDIMLF